MRVGIKQFAVAVAAAWAAWYAACYLLVAVAPGQLQSVLSFALHYDLNAVRPVSWGGFFGGLLVSTVWVAVFAATIGAFFNALGRRGEGEQGLARSRP
jgi:hypothetical protein